MRNVHHFCSCRNGKNFKSMNDMRSTSDQLLKEKGGLSLSVVKSLVRREKEERSSSDFFGDEETQSLMYSLSKLGMLSQDVRNC
jgi:Rab3 GTPase-activating protein catalytic subunit